MKNKEIYICGQCGHSSAKWSGRCESCGEWNSMEQGVADLRTVGTRQAGNINLPVPVSVGGLEIDHEIRYKTGADELDRVLGGGIVKGSLILLSGDPGIGKSTLLLQICQYLGGDHSVLYVTGEESAKQIKLRAERIGVSRENLYLIAHTNAEEIVGVIKKHKPGIVMIDSIQTMVLPQIQSAAGSVVQVRETANAFMQTAKSEDIPIFLVGHVNKDGNIAGPKVLEHAVDAVLYFEGDRNFSYRILRAVKNRYGPTNEIGVFEMRDNGLGQVENPSARLLEGRPAGVSGTCAACVMEGTRPILAEVQALVTKTGFGTPRRMTAGFDYNRMTLILAVLEKRIGYFFAASDVYINIAGGMKLDEPAADLAVAMALVSSLKDKVIPHEVVAFGEIGLTGEIRGISNITARVKEAARLGFAKCIIPKQSLNQIGDIDSYGIDIMGVSNIRQAFAALSSIDG
ncbi:MAG: DNA repair protein RadA [Oscillospiraceae bacterium]|nr:DNA repair protein RadA [Oscillospiraceae bacterium]